MPLSVAFSIILPETVPLVAFNKIPVTACPTVFLLTVAFDVLYTAIAIFGVLSIVLFFTSTVAQSYTYTGVSVLLVRMFESTVTFFEPYTFIVYSLEFLISLLTSETFSEESTFIPLVPAPVISLDSAVPDD